jgi:hypothetical protein
MLIASQRPPSAGSSAQNDGARDRQIWRGECHSVGGRYVMYGQPVLRLARIALLAVLVFLVVGLVVALGSPQTGPIEKAALALAIVGLLAAGVPVRRIGSQAEVAPRGVWRAPSPIVTSGTPSTSSPLLRGVSYSPTVRR